MLLDLELLCAYESHLPTSIFNSSKAYTLYSPVDTSWSLRGADRPPGPAFDVEHIWRLGTTPSNFIQCMVRRKGRPGKPQARSIQRRQGVISKWRVCASRLRSWGKQETHYWALETPKARSRRDKKISTSIERAWSDFWSRRKSWSKQKWLFRRKLT